jgi:hypothetical protein
VSIDLSRHNPWRPADWRWQRARKIAAGELRLSSRMDDKHVRRALRLARDVVDETTPAGQDAVANADPSLYWAYVLHRQSSPACRAEIEARIIAGEIEDELLRRVGVSHEVLQTYERVFFDVRDRLCTPAYVLNIIIGEAMHKGLSEKDYPTLWKFYGYTYGPRMLDSLIGQAIAPYKPRTAGEVKYAWQDDGIGSILRKQAIAARTVPVNMFTQLDILQVYSKFVEIDRAAGQDRASSQPESVLAGIEAMLKALPVDVGPYARLRVDSTTLSKYDAGAGELSAKQLLLAAQDIESVQDAEFETLTYPEVHDATIEQGS